MDMTNHHRSIQLQIQMQMQSDSRPQFDFHHQHHQQQHQQQQLRIQQQQHHHHHQLNQQYHHRQLQQQYQYHLHHQQQPQSQAASSQSQLQLLDESEHSKHKLFTADLVHSSSIDSASSRKDIRFPLSFEQQASSITPAAAATTTCTSKGTSTHTTKELQQETPLLDSYTAVPSAESTSTTCTTQPTQPTATDKNFTAKPHRSDAPIPRPNIMPRPFNINRRSLQSAASHSSSVNNVLRSSSSHPNFSAFSSPMISHQGHSMKVVSPVPSIITSECSDTTLNNSFQGQQGRGQGQGHTPVYNYTDNDSIEYGHEKGFVGFANDMNFLHKTNPSLHLNIPSPNRKNMASSPTEQYYFTPVHNDTNELDCISAYYPGASQSYIPQCREVPGSSMMDYNNHTEKMHVNYGFAPFVQQMQLRPYQMSSSDRGSFYGAPRPPMYCQPVSEPLSGMIKDRSSPIVDNTYISVPRKIQVSESPSRSRKKSIDSFESSNLSSSKDASSDDSATCSSPLPQNLKGDPHRQAKVKTELCIHYARGKICPFGSRCNYAHGEDELKYTKLFELQRAGLVEDVDTYRTHPCASWVATGACPFGLRCSQIHDPRLASETSSWLPHSDIPVSNLDTDLTVDKSYHYNLASLNQQNPLVHNLLWGCRPSAKKSLVALFDAQCTVSAGQNDADSEWRDTYSLVCNMANLYSWKKSSKSNASARSKKVSELEKLSIALRMSYSESNPTHSNYVYRPKHMVYDELCMVLQTKYFHLLRPTEVDVDDPLIKDLIIREITFEEYQGMTSAWNKKTPYCPNDVVVVHELAFGCLGESASKVSLWFDLPEPIVLTNSEIKRLKRNRQRKLLENNSHDALFKPSPFPGVRKHDEKNVSNSLSFEGHKHKPFFHMRPVSNDPVAFQLIQSILKHRILVLLLRKYSQVNDLKAREFHLEEEATLQMQFINIKNDIKKWKWPASKGKGNVAADTPVPRCSTEYDPSDKSLPKTIWECFLKSSPSLSKLSTEEEYSNSSLSVFRNLSKGRSVEGAVDNKLPHIKSHNGKKCGSSSDDVWASIIGENDNNGWNIIKEHYLGNNDSNQKDKNLPLTPPHGENKVFKK